MMGIVDGNISTQGSSAITGVTDVSPASARSRPPGSVLLAPGNHPPSAGADVGGKKTNCVYDTENYIYIIIYISNSDQQHVNSKLYSILKYIDVNWYKTKIIIWFCFNVQTNILACLTVLAFLGRTLCYHNPTMRVVCTGITEYCATRSWRTLSTSPVYSVHVQPRKDWFLRYSQFHCSSSYEPYTIHF